MAENNSVEDSYNPPPVATEFEETLFEDVEVDDLIWLSNNSLDGMVNAAHRKLDENSAQNLQTGEIPQIPSRQKVYQKT
jgi:hypothetical protein